jgi:integrase
MGKPKFTVLRSVEENPREISYAEKLEDHSAVLRAYFRTFEKRQYSKITLERVRRFLTNFFEGIRMEDPMCPFGERQLFIWELMDPVDGPQIIDHFAMSFNPEDFAHSTILKYMGEVRRVCDFVFAKPHIPGRQSQSIIAKYGRLQQPVTKYDCPIHVVDREPAGFAVTGVKLKKFLDYIRVGYIGQSQKKHTAARDYAMVVLGVTCGGRADELRHLDALGVNRDLFYEQGRVQIRFGKGTKGSGKRARKTIFTPFAQATMRFYEAQIRPLFPNAETNPALFLSETGERISYDAMWCAMTRIVENAREAGVELPPQFCWHDLRRSFATNFLEENPDQIWLLIDFLGHLNPGTVHRYIRQSREAFESATDRVLSRYLPASAGIQGAI